MAAYTTLDPQHTPDVGWGEPDQPVCKSCSDPLFGNGTVLDPFRHDKEVPPARTAIIKAVQIAASSILDLTISEEQAAQFVIELQMQDVLPVYVSPTLADHVATLLRQ